MNNIKWSRNELGILEKNYGKISIDELSKLLPLRNRKGIYRKASFLGLKFLYKDYARLRIPKILLYPREWNYLACAIDGEGMITLSLKTNKHYKHLQPQIQVSNTEESFIDYLIPFGFSKREAKSKKYKTCYYATKYGFGVLSFLKGFLNYSHHERKKQIAKLLIEFIELRLQETVGSKYSKKNGKYLKK